MAGPGDVALMPIAMIIKGIIIKGRNTKVRIMLTHLGIDYDCFFNRGVAFSVVLKDLDTLQTFAQLLFESKTL